MPAFDLEKIVKFELELMFFDISVRITGRIETGQFKSKFQVEGVGGTVEALGSGTRRLMPAVIA